MPAMNQICRDNGVSYQDRKGLLSKKKSEVWEKLPKDEEDKALLEEAYWIALSKMGSKDWKTTFERLLMAEWTGARQRYSLNHNQQIAAASKPGRPKGSNERGELAGGASQLPMSIRFGIQEAVPKNDVDMDGPGRAQRHDR